MFQLLLCLSESESLFLETDGKKFAYEGPKSTDHHDPILRRPRVNGKLQTAATQSIQDYENEASSFPVPALCFLTLPSHHVRDFSIYILKS